MAYSPTTAIWWNVEQRRHAGPGQGAQAVSALGLDSLGFAFL